MNTATSTPTIVSVEIENSPADEWSPASLTVWPIWGGVELDRPEGSGYVVKDRRMAERLKAAMLAGAIFYNVEVKTDVNGATFVSASSHVLARMMNADLRRLGF